MGHKIHPIHQPRMERLLSPEELQTELPANQLITEWICRSRQDILDVLHHRKERFLLIIGPCSIHDPQSALEYASKLRTLATEVSDTFLLVMRVHYEKPRTALGWKGFLYDPLLDGSNQMALGLRQTRELLLKLAEMRVPAAAELLDPLTVPYLSDLISWGCVGARTASSQIHRQMASGLHLPIAFKNSTDGDVQTAINGVLSAQSPHSFLSIDPQGCLVSMHTQGNPHCHVVLRGGENKPNYHPQSIYEVLEKLGEVGLPKRVVIDCSHDNSARKMELQPYVFQSVLRQYQEGNLAIRGLMLESHLFAGNQHMPCATKPLQYAVSLTDPCLDWETTERLIRWAHLLIHQNEEDSNCTDKMLAEPQTAYAQI